jgi:hypothetical protein
MQSINQALMKEVQKLKQENIRKGKLEKDESREELKKKDEEIKRLCKHNQDLLNDVKNVKSIYKSLNQRIGMKILPQKLKRILSKNLKRKFARRLRKP